jgi:hypothetical protein
MAALPRFSPVHDALQKGLANVAKWYDKTKDTSTYFICLGIVFISIDLLLQC